MQDYRISVFVCITLFCVVSGTYNGTGQVSMVKFSTDEYHFVTNTTDTIPEELRFLDCAAKCLERLGSACRSYAYKETGPDQCIISSALVFKSDAGTEVDDITADYILYSKVGSSDGRYKGCWLDAHGQRDLANHHFDMEAAVATIEHCIDSCKAGGYVFAGVQYYYECHCGNSFGRHEQKPDSDCNTPCLGDPTTICGGGLRNSIYSV